MQVVPQQVVAQHQLRIGGEALEVRKRRPLLETSLTQESPLPVHRADLVKLPIGAGLQIEQETAGKEIGEPRVHLRIMEGPTG